MAGARFANLAVAGCFVPKVFAVRPDLTGPFAPVVPLAAGPRRPIGGSALGICRAWHATVFWQAQDNLWQARRGGRKPARLPAPLKREMP